MVPGDITCSWFSMYSWGQSGFSKSLAKYLALPCATAYASTIPKCSSVSYGGGSKPALLVTPPPNMSMPFISPMFLSTLPLLLAFIPPGKNTSNAIRFIPFSFPIKSTTVYSWGQSGHNWTLSMTFMGNSIGDIGVKNLMRSWTLGHNPLLPWRNPKLSSLGSWSLTTSIEYGAFSWLITTLGTIVGSEPYPLSIDLLLT